MCVCVRVCTRVCLHSTHIGWMVSFFALLRCCHHGCQFCRFCHRRRCCQSRRLHQRRSNLIGLFPLRVFFPKFTVIDLDFFLAYFEIDATWCWPGSRCSSATVAVSGKTDLNESNVHWSSALFGKDNSWMIIRAVGDNWAWIQVATNWISAVTCGDES